MIDHVSVAVSDLARSGAFYDRVLEPLGMIRFADRARTIGYGTRYPEFWLNLREGLAPVAADTGIHVCLRAPGEEAVRRFHDLAVENGGRSDGAPGPRQAELTPYFGAFIRDPDGNKLEVITFPRTE